MHRLLIAVFLLALPHAAQAPSIPAPERGLTIRAGEARSTLLEVAESYAQTLQLPLVADQEARAALGRTRVGLVADLAAPPEAVHQVAQSLLVLGGFVITGIAGELRVEAYSAEGRGAIAIEEFDLARLAGHEALCVRMPAVIEGVPARQLSVIMRTLTAARVPAPRLTARGEHVLELEGPAESVRQMLGMLRRATGSAGAMPTCDLGALFALPESADGATLALEPSDTMLDVLARYAALTGRSVWVEAGLRSELAGRGCGLADPLECDARRAHAVVESLLAFQGLPITVRGGGAYAIHALQGVRRVAAARPVLVELEGVDPALLRDHPATIFGGVADLPRYEVRQLTTSLRTVMTDSSTQAMLALADHAIYLRGHGASLATLAEMFADMNGVAPHGAAAEIARAGLVGRPDSPFSLRVEEHLQLNLRDLLEGWSRATGRTVLIGRYGFLLKRWLETSSLEIESAELDATVERLLVEHGFGLLPLCLDPPIDAVAGEGIQPLAAPRYVAADELDALAEHPAHIVMSGVRLPNLEVRSLATALRKREPNNALRRVTISLGDQRLLVGGTVDRVRAVIEEVRGYDAAGEVPAALGGR